MLNCLKRTYFIFRITDSQRKNYPKDAKSHIKTNIKEEWLRNLKEGTVFIHFIIFFDNWWLLASKYRLQFILITLGFALIISLA
jgi:hypothetical protein